MGNKFQTKINFFQKGLDRLYKDMDRNNYSRYLYTKMIIMEDRLVLNRNSLTLEEAKARRDEAKAEGSVLLTKMGLYAIILDSIKRLKEMEESNEK